MKTKYIHFIPFLFLVACTTGEPEEEEIVPPEAATLVFPEDNTECNTGTSVNNVESTVTFEWEESENTHAYEVFVSELNTNATIQIEATVNEADITIKKATAYEWYVISKSNGMDETATSDTWRFYNAGDAEVNHAPFPADIDAPAMGSILSSVNSVTLEWVGNDIDNDIVAYEVFFGTENPPTTSMGSTGDANLTVDVSSGNTYYWYIKTIDATENNSESDVFWFSID